MKRYILAILVIFSLSIVGCVFNEPVKGSERHEFRYFIGIDLGVGDRVVDGKPIHNVTLILPYPCLNGTPLKLEIVSKPRNWNVSIVDTPYGKMLKIEAEVIKPVRMPAPIPIKPGETPKEVVTMEMPELNDLEIKVMINRTVNTLNPFEDYNLNPKFDVKIAKCSMAVGKEKCYKFKTKIFAKYEGDTEMHIYVSLEGRNEWFSYGWTGNEFHEWVTVDLKDPPNGWIDAVGRIECGKGVYK